jgi:hypothetical protein
LAEAGKKPGKAVVTDAGTALAEPSLAADPLVSHGIDKFLGVQRPAVLAHIRGIRSSAPAAAPTEVIRILEARYLGVVTAAGAAVGASAAIPGVSTGISLALSGVETATFLEASTMFAQSIAEIHGVDIEDPELVRALVMTMILGTTGIELIRKLAARDNPSGDPSLPWGLQLAAIPRSGRAEIAAEVKSTFVKRFTASQSWKAAGRLIPFGIGAVVGGRGNHAGGSQIIESSRQAFGPAPVVFPSGLELPVSRDADKSRSPESAPTPEAGKGFELKLTIPKLKLPRRKT